MGAINYSAIYELNKDEWKALTREPQKYEALLAGHYSDSNHFVYELLQNAEDENASKVVIEYYADKLIFYHDGDPFDEADVRGVSSMLMGTKDKNDAQTIGRFGMGFKSVFKYTYQPEIYSDYETFRIENYLLPVEINSDWNYELIRSKLECKIGMEKIIFPFSRSKHLTKIVIPFAKRKEDGSICKVSGEDVLDKLYSLSGDTLLFLNNVKSLYWCDMTSNKNAFIKIEQDKEDDKIFVCTIEGSHVANKQEVNKYIKFKKVFNHEKMRNAEVAVAYKLNSRGDNINELKDTDISVYFPTRDKTGLPFLIHGAFETAVSREKLMFPSVFNSNLFDSLGDLIAETLIDLSERMLITQAFIRKTIIAAFKDEEQNNTIPGLKEKITKAFLNTPLLPSNDEKYHMPQELSIPIPFRMADFWDTHLFGKSFENVKQFVAFNNERESNFNEYFDWLAEELKIQHFTLENWAVNITERLANIKIATSGKLYEELVAFYTFLNEHLEDSYKTGLQYTRSGSYERTIKDFITAAWRKLREAPVILDMDGALVSAYVDNEAMVYLNSSNKFKKLVASAVVNHKLSEEYIDLFKEGFKIVEFNNFQYIKERFISKYSAAIPKFKGDDEDNEYVNDIKRLLELTDEHSSKDEVSTLVKNLYIIRSVSGNYIKPSMAYVDISNEGIDLKKYFTLSDNSDDKGLQNVDSIFYEKNNIQISALQKLGLVCSPVVEGRRFQDGIGDSHWNALGEYCPEIDVKYIDEQFRYIEKHSNTKLAQEKSAVILKLLLEIAPKLKGKRAYRKNNPYEKEEESLLLRTSIRQSRWLFNKNMDLCYCTELSKYDLNQIVYSNLPSDKYPYEILGFIETVDDNKADAYDVIEQLDKKEKMLLLKQLARELGQIISASDPNESIDENMSFFNSASVEATFPVHKIKNYDSLLNHVREQFFCADPVRYEKVLRQIRISRNSDTERAYVKGMYTDEFGRQICQSCKSASSHVEAPQIANFGIEMPQLNLCLCCNCAGKYRAVSNVSKDNFRNRIKNLINEIDFTAQDDNISVQISDHLSISFTQTHIAEIQTIFSLIDEYGLPENENNQIFGKLKVVEAGKTIEYKNLFSGEFTRKIMRPDTFPLHKKMVGKSAGDKLWFNDVEYEIVKIMD